MSGIKRNSAFVGNRVYNDPSIGQAFANIAGMFGPPDAGDVQAYSAAQYNNARTKSEEADAQRLAEMFRIATDPNTSRDMIDRYGIGSRAFTPVQSFHALDENNATQRYGYDSTARTSRENNTADNTRALEERRLQEAGSMQRQLAQPAVVSLGQMFVPSAAQVDAGQFKGPIQGGVSLNPGETYTPSPSIGGPVLSGAPKLPTDAEIKAKILEGLPDNEKRAAALSSVRTTNVQTPAGPRVAFESDAVGQEPALDPSKSSELGTLQRERDAIARTNPNDPRVGEYNQRIAALGRGQQQSKYDQTNDEALATYNESIFKNAQAAGSNVATLNRIEQLLTQSGDDTGKWASVRLEARKALNALGIDAGDTSPQEVMRGLANKFALQLRDPSNGAGMPGSLSDSDRQFLASMSTNLDNSPGANRMVIDFYKKMNERSLEIEKMRRQYVADHGRVDEGFRNLVSDYANAHPLFADPTPGAGPGASPAAPAAPEFKILSVQ